MKSVLPPPPAATWMTAAVSHAIVTPLAVFAPVALQLMDDVGGWAPLPQVVRKPLATVAVMVRLNAKPVASAGTPDELALQSMATVLPLARTPFGPPLAAPTGC